MAYSVSEGSATISTTEYSLPAATTSGVPTSQTTEEYTEVWLDLNAMAAGDTFQVTIYEKVTSSSTQRKVSQISFTGAQGSPIAVIPALHYKNGWDITIKKIAGTDRTIYWSLRSVL